MKIAGYCKKCRMEEIELHGECVGEEEDLHRQACKAAGCLHPAYYGDGEE